MQPEADPFRVERRPLDIEDYIDIVRRHRSWIVGPILASLTIAVVAAFLWPDTYVSTAVIRVVPPQVPEKFVPTNINTQMSQRINSMALSILGRGTLTSIVETYGLYPRQRARLPMEDVIEMMRRDTDIGSVRSIDVSQRQLSAFHVSFSYENRYLAQKVAQDLVGRFITENTRERANQSAMTTQFLRDQWQAAKSELDAIEQGLTRYRIENAGRLPDQWMANTQQISLLENRLTSLNSSVASANQQKLLLEAELRVLNDRLKLLVSSAPVAAAVVRDPQYMALERSIRQTEQALAALLQQYRPNHPDVRQVESRLSALRTEMQELERKAAPSPGAEPVRTITPQQAAEARDLDTAIKKLQAQIQAKDLEVENYARETADVNRRIKGLQQLAISSPVGEQQYGLLLRDRELAQKRYDELNVKMSQSEIATDLENRKQAETLELLDAASLPEKPTQPRREMIIGAGLVIGLCLGGFMAGVRELKDTSLKNLKDVRAYTKLTVLGSVPLLENDLVIMRRRRLAWLAWSTVGLFAVLAMSGSVFYYYSTRL